MSVACLHIPHFSLRVSMLSQPQLDGHPLILSDPHHGRPAVLDTTPEARDKGVRTGLSLREATALCPDAIVVAPNPSAENEQVRKISSALADVSPLVEPSSESPGAWYIDLTGLGRHYDSVRDAGQHMLRPVNPSLRPRMGIALNKFAARIAANQSAGGAITLIPPSQTAQVLANAPVELLPLNTDALHQLHLMGIETLGQYITIPRAKIAARFGPPGRLAWDLAQGNADDPVTPLPRAMVVSEYLELPAPVTTCDVLMIAITHLVRRAFKYPELRYRHAREITIHAGLEHDRSWQRSLVFKEPYGPERLIKAVTLRLQHLELPGPVEHLAIDIHGIGQTTAHQTMLPALHPRQLTSLSDAVSMLKQRYGLSPLFRIMEVEPWSRIPERRHALVSFDP